MTITVPENQTSWRLVLVKCFGTASEVSVESHAIPFQDTEVTASSVNASVISDLAPPAVQQNRFASCENWPVITQGFWLTGKDSLRDLTRKPRPPKSWFISSRKPSPPASALPVPSYYRNQYPLLLGCRKARYYGSNKPNFYINRGCVLTMERNIISVKVDINPSIHGSRTRDSKLPDFGEEIFRDPPHYDFMCRTTVQPLLLICILVVCEIGFPFAGNWILIKKLSQRMRTKQPGGPL